MAIRPADAYPGQTLVTDGWPQGKARNRTIPGDPTGTPLEEQWLNDLWGFEQALLDAAGFTPSGAPDQLDVSQYLQAIQKLYGDADTVINNRVSLVSDSLDALTAQVFSYYAAFGIVDAQKDNGERFNLGQIVSNNSGFTLSGGNQIQVPHSGWYEVTISGHVKSDDSTNGVAVDMWVEVASSRGAPAFVATTQRAGTATAERAAMHRTLPILISSRTTQKISVTSGTDGASLQDSAIMIRLVA